MIFDKNVPLPHACPGWNTFWHKLFAVFWLKKTLIQAIVSDQTTCIIPVYWPIFYFLSLPPSHFLFFFIPPNLHLPSYSSLPLSLTHSLSLFLYPHPSFSPPFILPPLSSMCWWQIFNPLKSPPPSDPPSMTPLLPPAPLFHDPPPPSLSGGNTKTTIPPTYLRSGSICPSLPPLRSDSSTSLPVSRCLLLFSPSKDGYAPKSVYPLRYVIVGSLSSLSRSLFLLSFLFVLSPLYL